MLVRVAAAFVFALSLAACSDDGADVVESSASESGSASGSTSGSGSGSASGLADQDLSGSTDDAVILAAVDEYRTYVQDEVSTLIDETTVFTDAVRAGDIDAAKAAFAPSRFHWETIEPIAGLVEQIDGAVDARVDDFANETDPAWTGWHRIEYLLWEQGDVAAAVPFADQLDADLATLQDQLAGLDLPPAAVALGAAELVEEVSEGKITGEEDRARLAAELADLAESLSTVPGTLGLS